VRICAFLAPYPVPAVWFTLAARQLQEPLRAAAADPLAWGHVLIQTNGQALVRIDRQELHMHRLTRAIIRTSLTPEDAAAMQAEANELVTAALLDLGPAYAQAIFQAPIIGWSYLPHDEDERMAIFKLAAHLLAP
jgi:hypothetical protein